HKAEAKNQSGGASDPASDPVSDTVSDLVSDTGSDLVSDTGSDLVSDTGSELPSDAGSDSGSDPPRRLFQRLDNLHKGAIDRAGDPVLPAELDDGAVHEINLGRFAPHQILAHGGNVARRTVELRKRADVVLAHNPVSVHAVRPRDLEALVNHQSF